MPSGREPAQLVVTSDDRVERLHHGAPMAVTLVLGPRRDRLEVPGAQGHAVEPQGALGHRPVRDELAVHPTQDVHPAERVVPVLLGEPSLPGGGEQRPHLCALVIGQPVARDDALLDHRTATAAGWDRSAFA